MEPPCGNLRTIRGTLSTDGTNNSGLISLVTPLIQERSLMNKNLPIGTFPEETAQCAVN